ncbi:MAG: late competence development ComFB family protein [Tissierellales bacterium]
MIKNYMEILVDEIFDEISKNYKICTNETCIDDIKSVALNNLQPQYFTSDVSESEKKAFLLDKQRRIAVMASIISAKETVCKNCKKNED